MADEGWEFDGRVVVAEMLTVVAYAELRTVMLAWARVPRSDPRWLASCAVRSVLEGAPVPVHQLGARVRAVVRATTADALERAAQRLGPFPWDRAIADGQVGDLAGLEQVFHDAGEAAVRHRRHDVRALAAAVNLSELVRRTIAPT